MRWGVVVIVLRRCGSIVLNRRAQLAAFRFATARGTGAIVSRSSPSWARRHTAAAAHRASSHYLMQWSPQSVEHMRPPQGRPSEGMAAQHKRAGEWPANLHHSAYDVLPILTDRFFFDPRNPVVQVTMGTWNPGSLDAWQRSASARCRSQARIAAAQRIAQSSGSPGVLARKILL